MTKDSLTKKEKQVFLKNFEKRFYENYKKALNSGAVSAEDLQGDHVLARCILVITAHQWEPLSRVGKEMLSNLEKFV